MVIIYVPMNPGGPKDREIQNKYLRDIRACGWNWKENFSIGPVEFAIFERDSTTEEELAAVLKQLEAMLGHPIKLKQIPLFIEDMQKEMKELNEKVREIEEDTE